MSKGHPGPVCGDSAPRDGVPVMYHVAKGIIAFLSTMMPTRSAMKIVAMVLLAINVPVKDATRYSGFKKTSVYDLRRRIRRLRPGMDFVSFVSGQCTVAKGRGRKSPIRDIRDSILEHLETTNCHTLAEIQKWILDEHGISVSRSHLSKFLKDKGYRKLKGGSVPARADCAAQRAFYVETLGPLMRGAGGRNVLLFMDASHFVMGCDFIGSVYCRKRRFVKSLSGRKRYNVLGALDYVTKKVLTVTNDTYINAESVCGLLRKIRAAYRGKIINVVLDNASYQKCAGVRELAGSLHINLVFLPAYSPNLNLIERIWRFTKAELRKNVWDCYESFSGKIDSIVESTTGENREKIESLIGKKVQLFDDVLSDGGDSQTNP